MPVSAPVLPQPGTGQAVAVRTQNAGAAQHVSFGQAFKPGAVPDGATLGNAQLDVKTRHGDGSVRFGVVTLSAPAGEATHMLALGTLPGGAVSLPVALASQEITVVLSGGVTATLDIGRAVSSSADFWQQGPLATQARVGLPVVGALHVIADVTAYADGRVVTDLTFANDYAMGPTGGTRSYTATIRRNGAVVYTSPALTHYQYQQWRWTDRGSDVHVQVDARYLVETGAVLNFDLGLGVESTSIGTAAYAPLGAAGIEKAMPGTGDRDDIGPITNPNAKWLLSQDRAAASVARAQASAAASIPWHFYDQSRGAYLSLDDWPTLWADGRGSPTLTQQIAEPTWTPDTAHQPNLSFIPYLLTGERFHLDQIDAQATASEFITWNDWRQNGLGAIAGGADQERSQAWVLRQLSDAAWATPDGTPRKAYWQRIVKNNLDELRNVYMPRLTTQAAQTYGFLTGYAYGVDATVFPFTQDFYVQALTLMARRGDPGAREVMTWAGNWQVGRFLHGWVQAVAYRIAVGPSVGSYFTTWAAYEAANGKSDAVQSDGSYYVANGLATLANHASELDDAYARTTWGEIRALGLQGTSDADYRTRYAKFAISPGSSVEPPPPPPPPPPSGPESLWSASLTGPRNQDGSAWQLGTVFMATRPGVITRWRVYSAGESGKHTAAIFDNSNGNRLRNRSWTYSGTGWKTVVLSSPLRVVVGRAYTVTVTTGGDSGRRYAGIPNALGAAGGNDRSLTHPANAGVFGTNLTTRPTQVWQATNYLRDVVFVPD